MTASRDRADLIRAHFRTQAAACERLGSPFTAALLAGLAERMEPAGALEARVLSWPGDPGDDALALRVAGALHALARAGRDPEVAAAWPPRAEGDAVAVARAAFVRQAEWLAPWLDGPPQTNETGRSGALLGGLLALADLTGGMPVELLEIGASAGLNQNLDAFRYDFGDGRAWGPPDSPVLVRHAWRGAPPPLDARLEIAARAGCDLNPLDAADPAARARLLAYIWPDQAERLARAEAAVALAVARPRPIETADAAAWLETRLAAPQPEGRARVVMHSIMWQYMPAAVQARIAAALTAAAARATAARPFAWLRMEPDGETGSAAVTLTLAPEGGERLLARTDFHGRWTDWAGRAPAPDTEK
ncbi:DUF2332 domain-containing protein [Albimonas pacifica]|uniref:DUF2332 domain-containing protein n=1 Tax=Albimonas pacifica TaxID=1114924 RepID=A0A1I3IMC0_9RHOB|nr:DUF2332 family protein [Albimonas pacifica]SFI48933.1 hypothetical protein SAMN05216258_107129 [Albimonas pacifica]